MDNQTPPTLESQPSTLESTAPEQLAKPYGRNWKKWILIYLIIGAVLYAGVYYFVLSKQDSKPESQPVVETTISPTPDPTADWKTYAHPTLDYSLRYPASWKGGIESIPETIKQDYEDFVITSPDYKLTTEGKVFIEKGASIFIGVDKATESTIENNFKNDYLLSRIAQSVKRITVNGKPAIQYDYNYEFVTATDTIFIVNGMKYLIKLQYPDKAVKNQYWDIYQQILSTFKVTDQNISQDFLNIDAWKLRLAINSGLTNLKSKLSGDNQEVKILAPELDSDWKCTADEDGNKATVGSIVRTSDAAVAGSFNQDLSKTIGDYTYSYQAFPTSRCTSNPRYQELVKELELAFSSLENY